LAETAGSMVLGCGLYTLLRKGRRKKNFNNMLRQVLHPHNVTSFSLG
jgi:hypothetical protein